MIKLVAAAALVSIAAPVSTTLVTADATTAAIGPRGAVVSAAHVQHLSASAVRGALSADGFSAAQVQHGGRRLPARLPHDRCARRCDDSERTAVLPHTDQRNLRVVTYTHGTMSAREAPSVDSGERSDEGLMLGSAGYAAVLPDYLGLGVGPGTHPYMHLRSEVSAELDMLRAARTFAAGLQRSFDRRVLVTGFSQGGDVAMAFGKALQRKVDPRFRLAADAPISGPYSLTGQELPAALDGRLDPTLAAFYLAYVMVAYDRVYHLYDSASDVFAAPYDRTVATMFDGLHDERAIFRALPDAPNKLFTATWLTKLEHPTGPCSRP